MNIEQTWTLDPATFIEEGVMGMMTARGAIPTWSQPCDLLNYYPDVEAYPDRDLFSTSIFWPRCGDHRVSLPARSDYRWFLQNLITGAPPRKYFDAMERRARRVVPGDVIHRVYLDYRLRDAAQFLKDHYNFDQVVLMYAGETEPMRNGMMWRYLPLQESWRTVTCTGIDDYAEPLKSHFLDTPMPEGVSAEFVMTPPRRFNPFAGPIRLKPGEFWEAIGDSGFCLEMAYDGFLSMWDESLPESYHKDFPIFTRLMHSNRTVNQRVLKITDATLLTALFWRRSLLGRSQLAEGGLRLVNDHAHVFAGYRI